MSSKRKVCVVTGSRAEYGLLKLTMQEIKEASDLTLQIIATGSHLSRDLGETLSEIEDDGFIVDCRASIIGEDDSAGSVVNSISMALEKFSEFYQEICPDIILVLGDRYEIFAAASAALIHKIPVAHIHGGEVTQGAFDESMRHSITKMSHLHMASCELHANRIIQMGEDPESVFNVGAPGIEAIKSIPLLDKKEVEKKLSFQLSKRIFLVTYHPETLNHSMSPRDQIRSILDVLKGFEDVSIIFTKANADPGGKDINDEIANFVQTDPNSYSLYPSLGQLTYLSLMNLSDAVIGNSSSGIIEATALGKAVINIGDRQKGRAFYQNIIHCSNDIKDIRSGFSKLKKFSVESYDNPQDGGKTSSKIVNIIRDADLSNILQKRFVDS